MLKKLFALALIQVVSGCATNGDSAAIAFTKETGCPADQVRFEALLDGTNLYQVTGCGKEEHYACQAPDEAAAKPVVCTKIAQ